MLALPSNAHRIMASTLLSCWLQKFCHASSLEIHITGDSFALNFGRVNPVDMIGSINVGVDTVLRISGGVTIVSVVEGSVGGCELFCSVNDVVSDVWFSLSV